jgi:hypothetical protein
MRHSSASSLLSARQGLNPAADRAGRLSITWRAVVSKLATRGATKRAAWAEARARRGCLGDRRSAPAAASLVDAMRRAGSRWLDASGAKLLRSHRGKAPLCSEPHQTA